MTMFKKNVTRSDVRDNLAQWILKGIGFSTPVRDTGMMTATYGYVGGLRCATISGRLERQRHPIHGEKLVYIVYSYETPIMWVFLEEDEHEFIPLDAEFDNRKYSATTNLMQGYCESALREIFDVGFIPPIIGKRGGRHVRRNFMGVTYLPDLDECEWVVIENGEYVGLCQDGDNYVNDDTEGYY